MRTLSLVLILLLTAVAAFCQVIEAETGALSGTQIATQHAGFSGSGYVTGFDADGDQVSVSFQASKGVYSLYMTYASPSGNKFNFIAINGVHVGRAIFPRSASFTETRIGKVYLEQGANSLSVVKEWGYIDLDNFRLEPDAAADISGFSSTLVTPAPTEKSDSLYTLLSKLYGKVILSGQYGGTTEFDHIRNVSGRTPVIRGFDLIDYSPSRVERGATSNEVDKAIEWSRQRGIVTFCWHWNAPADLIDAPGKEWWRGFYTEATAFDVAKAMNDPGSIEHSLVMRDIDAIAVQLKKLADANVPVLWRPLHEAEGRWFWWGAKGPEACKWLWRRLFDRLVHHHALNNLIWVWTSTGNPEAPDWYPGDDYVDMIGADIYLPAGAYSSHFITFDNIASRYGGKKMIALSENGPMPDAEQLFRQGAAWSWFATWSGDFITGGVMNDNHHINAVFNHDYVITLDEIDRIEEIVALLEAESEAPDTKDPITGVSKGESPAIVFHNPIIDDRLVLQTGGRAKVTLYTLQGQIQFPEVNTSGNHYIEFDFASKPPGLYILKVVKGRSIKAYRVVKE